MIAPRVQQIQAERDRLVTSLERMSGHWTLTAREIEDRAEQLGGIVSALERMEQAQRALFYAELGVKLVYCPPERDNSSLAIVRATADLPRVGRGRVGGPTRNLGPRPVEADSGWSDLCRVA